MDKPNYYGILPADVRYDKGLRPAARLLYCEITALAGKSGCCTAGNSYFAALYDVSKKTVESWLHQLSQAKYIEVEVVRDEAGAVKERRIWLAGCQADPPLEKEDTSPKNIGDLPSKSRSVYRKNNNIYITPIVPQGGEPAPKDDLPFTADQLAKAYSTFCPHLTRLLKLTQNRRRAAKRLAQSGLDLETICAAFQRADASAFLSGQGERGWKADFDWMIREDNLLKVLEGKYDNAPQPEPSGRVLIDED